MRRRISVQLSERIAERLEAAVAEAGASRRAIVETALERALDPDAQASDATLRRRLDGMSRQLEELERELKIVNETVALHARYHLTVTPPLPQTHQRVACVLGLERFEAFAAQVWRRVQSGTPLMRETMERLGATGPGLFAHRGEEAVPLGAPCTEAGQDPCAPPVVRGEPEASAGAREDASNGGFPGESRNP